MFLAVKLSQFMDSGYFVSRFTTIESNVLNSPVYKSLCFINTAKVCCPDCVLGTLAF